MSKLLVGLLLVASLFGQNPNTAAFPTTVATDANLPVAKRAAQSTLSGTINSSTTSITVASGAAFLDESIILIDNEEMLITNISSNTLTVTRGFNGTTAASHTGGRPVQNVISSYNNNALAAEMKAVQARLRDRVAQCVDAGSTDAYACSPAPSLGSYSTGQRVAFKANTANTGAATFAANGLSALAIKKLQGGITTDLATNDIRANQWVDVVYDGTNWQMLSALGNVADLSAYLLSATHQAGTPLYCRSTSGNDTYACALTPTLTAYTRGGCLVLDADTANTGAATVNVDSVGAKSILNRAGSSLSNGDITANKPITICYDGTQYIIQGDGGGGGGGTGDALITEVQNDSYKLCTASNGSTTYTCTMTPTLTGYTDGMVINFVQTGYAHSSGESATLNIDALGAKALVTPGSIGLGVGCYPSQNRMVRLRYKSSTNAFEITDCLTAFSKGIAALINELPMMDYQQCTSSSGSSPFTCSLLSGVGSYATGLTIQFKSGGASITAAANINIDSMGNKAIKQADGNLDPSADCPISEDIPTLIIYDGTVFRMAFCHAPHGVVAGTGISVSQTVDNQPEISINGTVAVKAGIQSTSYRRCASSTGSDTYTCTMTPTLLAYTDGMLVEFEATATANTGAASLNIDTLGAVNIKLCDGSTDPATGDIAIGRQIALRYDGTVFRLPCNPATVSGSGVNEYISICHNETDAWNPAASTTYYQGAYLTPQASNNGLVRFVSPVDGTIVGVTVAGYISTTSGVGATTTVTVQKAGSDTSVAATISLTASDTVASGTGSTAVTKNDLLNYKIVTGGYSTAPVGLRMRYCTLIKTN